MGTKKGFRACIFLLAVLIALQPLGMAAYAEGAPVDPAASGIAITDAALDGAIFEYGEQISIPVVVTGQDGTPTGDVRLIVDDIVYNAGPWALDGAGAATLQVDSLPAGNHALEAEYVGDAVYAGSMSPPVHVTVSKGATSTRIALGPENGPFEDPEGDPFIEENPTVHGQAFTLKAEVSRVNEGAGAPTGKVRFSTDYGILGEAEIVDGAAVLPVNATEQFQNVVAGYRTFYAEYLGSEDGNFAGSTDVRGDRIYKASTVISAVTQNTGVSQYGQYVYLTVLLHVTDQNLYPGDAVSGHPTGMVTFYNNGVSLGTAQVQDYVASHWDGETVIIDDDDMGIAVLSVRTMDLGLHNLQLTAEYSGDSNFAESNSAAAVIDHTVTKSNTIVGLQSSANPSRYGQKVTFTAQVWNSNGAGAVGNPYNDTIRIPTGTLSFYDTTDHLNPILLGEASLDSEGKAVIDHYFYEIKTHRITAAYSGDQYYRAGRVELDDEILQVVVTSDTIASVTNVTKDPTVYGEPFTIRASVAAQAPGGEGPFSMIPTGAVVFKYNGTVLGTAALDWLASAALTLTNAQSRQDVNVYNITAEYLGDDRYNPTVSAPVQHTVIQSDSTTEIDIPADPTVYGQAFNISANVAAVSPGSGTPTGNVEFYDGDVLLGASALNGAAAAVYTITEEQSQSMHAGNGQHIFSAKYVGDMNFHGSESAAAAHTVTQAASATTVAFSKEETAYGEAFAITASVSATAPGSGTPAGSVEFYNGGALLGTVNLNESAEASYVLTDEQSSKLAIGSNSFSAVYAGNSDFAGSGSGDSAHQVMKADSAVSVTSSSSTSEVGRNIKLTASVSAQAPGAGAPTGIIEFFDGETSLAVADLEDSQATLEIANLTVGEHTITAAYSGDGFFNGNEGNIVQIVKEAAPVFGGGIIYTPAPETAEIIVNGKVEDAGTMNTVTANGRSATTVTTDPKKLHERLAAEGSNAVITIPVTKDSDVIIGSLTGKMVKEMEEQEAIVELKTGSASYTVPAAQINIDSISEQLGEAVGLEDISILIEIAEPEADTLRMVGNAADEGNFTLVALPVNFTVRGTYGSKTIEVEQYNAYVERTIAIPEGIDPSKITTGVVVDADGTVRHVPTRIVQIEGTYYAQLNSLTNSTYSVIWNPVTFADVEQHWAKDAVNEMGSRMVISGDEKGLFNPDQSITRAEFAAIMVRALGLKPGSGLAPFSDVPVDSWYNGAVQAAYKYGLINGYEDETFRPDENLSREQAMVIIAKAMKITELHSEVGQAEAVELLRPFSDASEVAEWAMGSAADVMQAGIISGRDGSKLAPKELISRAEVATMVRELLRKSGLI